MDGTPSGPANLTYHHLPDKERVTMATQNTEKRQGFVNEAPWDRILRVALGLVMLYLGWSGAVDGALGVVLQWLGFVPLLTGLVGWCPLYRLFGIRTNKV